MSCTSISSDPGGALGVLRSPVLLARPLRGFDFVLSVSCHVKSHVLAIICTCTTRSAAGRQPRPVSSKGSYGDASQPVSVTTVDGRTVRRWSGGTVASQEPCRPVPVRCSSHRSAGVAPPVRWRPCPIGPPLSFGIRWYLLNNVAR